MTSAALIAGLLFGIGAATCQAVSYLYSRRFLSECRDSTQLLFCISHLQMGAASLLALPLLGADLRGWEPIGLAYLAGTAGFYLLGQWLLFRVLRFADSSQVAPLLGLKILILALVSALFLAEKPSLLGWLAVAVATAAGVVIAPPRRALELRTLLLTSLACLGFASSDLCIPQLIDSLRPISKYPALLGACLTYISAGGVGLVMLARYRKAATPTAQRYALPYSIAWMTAMIFLFICFANVGFLLGNILQATRGLISVGLGLLVARLGWLHLDSIGRGRGLLRRGIGATMMTLAIIIYLCYGRRPAPAPPLAPPMTATNQVG